MVASPASISTIPAAGLAAILERLLECRGTTLERLSQQCYQAIQDLPDDSRPDQYEALLDVARYCVEEDPGWNKADKSVLLAGHPRIGAPLKAGKEHLSDESRKEQMKGGDADQATLKRLRTLNALYELRFPGLRFVTHVAGRSRSAIADELALLIGTESASLAPDDLNLDPESPDPSFQFPATLVVSSDSPAYDAELERGLEALWNIGIDRSASIVPDAPQDNKTDPKDPKSSDSDPKVAQNVPFLNLATFRMLILSSAVLETFFERDLPASFVLSPAERSSSGGAFAWHAAPTAPGAPRAVPGAKNGGRDPSSTGGSFAYSRDVTPGARGRVVGFLGGLLGEEGKQRMTQLADTVGQRLQTHTVTGPRPSFGRDARTLDGSRMDTDEIRQREQEQKRAAASKWNFGSRLADAVRGTSAAASSSPASAPPVGSEASQPLKSAHDEDAEAAAETRRRKRASLRGTDFAQAGPGGAAESLRAATAAIQERDHFVIDEPSAMDGDATADDDEEEDEDVGDVGDAGQVARAEAELGMGSMGLDDAGDSKGELTGKEAQLAKDLRTAPAQR